MPEESNGDDQGQVAEAVRLDDVRQLLFILFVQFPF